MPDWIEEHSALIARRAVRDLEAIVGVSSPSGDVPGAEEAIAVAAALAPTEAEIARLPCSTPRHAPDLLLRLAGTGERRLLLLGHLDTVFEADSPVTSTPARSRSPATGSTARGPST